MTSRWITLLLASLFTLVSLPSHAALPLQDSQGKTLPTLAPMLEKTTPAVVNIATRGSVRVQGNPLFSDPFFRHFFDIPEQAPRMKETQSLGSGVIVDAQKGYILTNNHVIDKADEITVTLRNGENYQAKLIGTDPDSDVAVIQIQADNLMAIPLGKSDQMRVGDFVVAIGNPFGLGQTVTSGIISAMERSGLGIEGYENFIQTDASINPGNSGGALVNLNGELIGINTAIFSKSGGNIGIGFAIPINMAQAIMAQLLEHGEVKRGRLGAQAQDLTPQLAQAFDIKGGQGAVITQVDKDSPADRAGLLPGDIVVSINGKKVRDGNTLRNTVGLLRIGDKVTMQILREGKQKTISVKVEEASENTADVMQGDRLHARLEGADIINISEGSRQYGKIEGVVVNAVEPGSPAARTGLRPGDIITSANRKNINSIAEFKAAIGKNKTLLLNIRRGNGSLFLYLQ